MKIKVVSILLLVLTTQGAHAACIDLSGVYDLVSDTMVAQEKGKKPETHTETYKTGEVINAFVQTGCEKFTETLTGTAIGETPESMSYTLDQVPQLYIDYGDGPKLNVSFRADVDAIRGVLSDLNAPMLGSTVTMTLDSGALHVVNHIVDPLHGTIDETYTYNRHAK